MVTVTLSKILHVAEKPYTQREGTQFLSTAPHPAGGYWLVYANLFLSAEEVLEVVADSANLATYLQ